MHPLPLNSPVDTARTAFATVSTTDNINNNDECATDDTNDATDNDKPVIMVTATNKKTTTAAAATKSGRGSSPRFAKISNAMCDPKKCSDMFNSLT